MWMGNQIERELAEIIFAIQHSGVTAPATQPLLSKVEWPTEWLSGWAAAPLTLEWLNGRVTDAATLARVAEWLLQFLVPHSSTR